MVRTQALLVPRTAKWQRLGFARRPYGYIMLYS